MRVFKPLDLSLQYKVYQWENQHHLAVAILLGFPFNDGEPLSEPDLWRFLADELDKDAILDACMPKAHGEVLVYGSFFTPTGGPCATGNGAPENRICG